MFLYFCTVKRKRISWDVEVNLPLLQSQSGSRGRQGKKDIERIGKRIQVVSLKDRSWKTKFLQKASAAFVKADTSQDRLVKHLNAE